MVKLFHRREVWRPTPFGWLVFLLVAVATLAILAVTLEDFLAVREPARGTDGRGARTLVIEGWLLKEDLDQVIAAYRAGHYERVVATGGPLDSWQAGANPRTFAERAATYLNAGGLLRTPVVAVPTPATARDRTYLSALMVRHWAEREHITLDSVDVYTSSVHARRSRLLYRMALGGGVEVGVLGPTLAPLPWWQTSETAKAADHSRAMNEDATRLSDEVIGAIDSKSSYS